MDEKRNTKPDIKFAYPTLEDLMFKNKSAKRISKKKKNYKKYNDYIKSRQKDNEREI